MKTRVAAMVRVVSVFGLLACLGGEWGPGKAHAARPESPRPVERQTLAQPS